MNTVDYLIIGGGIIGLTIAVEIKRRDPSFSIVIIEKEKSCGMHASWRNSGVLHAGFYYTNNSLKAKLTRDGNKMMKDYCRERKIIVNNCGKLVVTQNYDQLKTLKELYRRGQSNNVELEWISEDEARRIEPNVITHWSALWSPTTASVNPESVMSSLVKDAISLGVKIQTDTAYIGRKGNNNHIITSKGAIECGYVINCAGLYADRVALDFNFSKSYRIVPFKGVYLYADINTRMPKTNIYPVPDLDWPFLGVHYTVTFDGRVKIGPTAMPAFWRENYNGLQNFDIYELSEILSREFDLFITNKFNFRKIAIQEMKKYRKKNIINDAKKLLKGVSFSSWGAPGIRAQLMDLRDNSLVMDFVYEGDKHSFHVLNAVSPGFTCSLSFAKYMVDEIEKLNA